MDTLNYRCGVPCPKCGSTHTEIDVSCVLTTYPPQYRYQCLDCKHIWTGFGESTIGPITSWPDLKPGISVEPFNYGWICPKCGRVYSPSTNQCFHCEGGFSPNIVYCGNSNNGTVNVLDNVTLCNDTSSDRYTTIVDMARNAVHEELQDSIRNSKK